MGRRAERQQIENHRFVVAFPAVGQKAGVGFRSPAVAEGEAALQHPVPLDALVKHRRERADLGLVVGRTVEVLGSGECAGNKERRVDAG